MCLFLANAERDLLFQRHLTGFTVVLHLVTGLSNSQSPDFPNAKKYVFSQFQTKNSQFGKKKFFVLHFHFIQYNKYRTYCYIFTISQNNRIQPHLLLSLPFLIVHLGKFNYWNQSSNGNIRTMSNFPILVKTP